MVNVVHIPSSVIKNCELSEIVLNLNMYGICCRLILNIGGFTKLMSKNVWLQAVVVAVLVY